MNATLMCGAATLLFTVAAASGEPMPDSKSTPTITREDYRGWPDTYRLTNGRIEAAVLSAIGPRIIELKAAGGKNLFHVRDAEAGGHGEAEWVFRGGWRLWIAPERRATTYVPDNASATADNVGGTKLRCTRPPPPQAVMP